MTIQKLSQIDRFIGTLAEREAMDTTGIPAGSKFFESDTGETYVFDGASTWTRKVQSPSDSA